MTLTHLMILGMAIIILILGEGLFPLRVRQTKRLRHYFQNFLISLPALGVARIIVLPMLIWTSNYATHHHYGLSGHFEKNTLAVSFLIFVIYDYSFYFWHRINHEWKFLWRFHLVHHIDVDLDITTNLRFHFMEVLLSLLYRGGAILLIGVPVSVIVTYETAFQLSTLFHHSNLKLPLQLEKSLVCLVATPRFHGIHHSREENERDANYAVIFIFWDRLHRTMNVERFREGVTIGIEEYDRPITAMKALKLPFTRQLTVAKQR